MLMSTHPRASQRITNQFGQSPFAQEPAQEERSSVFSLAQLLRPEDLSVVFQPIVHMETFRVYAYEALVRCAVPALSNPAELFERAVEVGCVGRLGRMVREVAVPLCEGRPLFVNVHPAELQGRWLVQPDDPMYFHDHEVFVEVTESVPLSHFELCRDVLKEVRARGNAHLVVDDLGAGYSNLKRIADLEPRIVKLDRAMVTDVTRGSRQQRLVTNIVRLCVDMGAEVVAEGIETVDEWRALADTGVHYAQGYLFARPAFPLPSVQVPAALERMRASRSSNPTRVDSVFAPEARASTYPLALGPRTPSLAPPSMTSTRGPRTTLSGVSVIPAALEQPPGAPTPERRARGTR